jgi:hypothetical protein
MIAHHIRRAAIASLMIGVAFAPARAQTERVDVAAIQRIRDEGMNRSQVMEISSWLTDV